MKNLTKFGRPIAGEQNKIRGWNYIRSDIDNDDEKVLQMKDSAKTGMKYFGIFILAIIVNFIMI